VKLYLNSSSLAVLLELPVPVVFEVQRVKSYRGGKLA